MGKGGKGREKGREGRRGVRVKEGKGDGCVMAFGGMDAPAYVVHFSPSVLQCCWLGDRKDVWPAKTPATTNLKSLLA